MHSTSSAKRTLSLPAELASQYEIWVTGWPKTERTLVQRFNDGNAALQFAWGIRKAPGCVMVDIIDRVRNETTEVH